MYVEGNPAETLPDEGDCDQGRDKAMTSPDKRSHRSSTTTAAAAVLSTLAALALTACTVSFDNPGPLTCTTSEDCPESMGCAVEVGLCFETCTVSESCPTLAYRCEGGLCLPVVGAECEAHVDCDSPGLCEVIGEDSCVEGRCEYPVRECDTPPDRECTADDMTVRIFGAVGYCDTDPDIVGVDPGSCVYEVTEVPCPGCQQNCLQQDPCEGILCPDENGGCQVHGVCLPTNPPTCQYNDSPLNTACDLPGSATGALDGFCNEGLCGAEVPIPCTDNAECSPRTCIGELCRPIAAFQGTCDSGDNADCEGGLVCSAGVCLRAAGQSCQTNGECAGTCINLTCASQSGENGPCDTAGGGDDDDCQAALNCNSGVCETGIACTTNSVCNSGDVCISGYCRAPAATGGTCDSGEDGDCVSGHACVSGVCLRLNGQSCSSNSQCVNVCISSTCDDQSGTRQPCDTSDGAADCQSGRTCTSGLCLLLDGQSGCTDDNQCINTCIAGSCGPRVGTGSSCDSAGDCLANHTCSGGLCLLDNGQGCSANSQCVNVCVGGLCGATSGTRGSCDAADGNADCQSGHTCTGGLCLLNNGQSCSANNQCVNTCIASTCIAESGTGGDCDSGDDDDCQSGRSCAGGVCLLDNGQSCTSNSQCVNTCINLSCANLSGQGGDCDTTADCQGSYVCYGDQCVENGIAQISVTGSAASGGGGSSVSGWWLVDQAGADLGQVSSGAGQYLYQSINWTVDLNTVLVSGDYFALIGDDGSADTTRTFTFFDVLGAQVDQVVVGPMGTHKILHKFTSTDAAWTRFYYDGSQVTDTQIIEPIARILVEGTSTSSGGGNGLSGYYEVSAGGANLGQLSPGHTQTLYYTSSWEVVLTTPITSGMEFALVGAESSVDITRTFTFKDSGGGTISTATISNTNSGDIIRSNTWSSGDTYIHFEYTNGTVTQSSNTSQ